MLLQGKGYSGSAAVICIVVELPDFTGNCIPPLGLKSAYPERGLKLQYFITLVGEEVDLHSRQGAVGP